MQSKSKSSIESPSHDLSANSYASASKGSYSPSVRKLRAKTKIVERQSFAG